MLHLYSLRNAVRMQYGCRKLQLPCNGACTCADNCTNNVNDIVEAQEPNEEDDEEDDEDEEEEEEE